MALFSDGAVSSIEELRQYESSVLDVAGTEGIDLEVKLALAGDELAIELEAMLAWQDGAPGLEHVVVTEPLRKWHAFRTLALVYRDAFNRQLNDRYLGKWREHQRLSRWASQGLLQKGLGMTHEPVPRAEKPELSSVAGALPAATYFVRVAWQSASGQEGAPSGTAVLSVPEGGVLVVAAVAPPANAAGFNVYAGFSETALGLQTDTAAQVGQGWTEPASGLRQGRAPGTGQAPSYFFRPARILHRG